MLCSVKIGSFVPITNLNVKKRRYFSTGFSQIWKLITESPILLILPSEREEQNAYKKMHVAYLCGSFG